MQGLNHGLKKKKSQLKNQIGLKKLNRTQKQDQIYERG